MKTSFEFKAKSVSFLVNKYPGVYDSEVKTYRVAVSRQVPHKDIQETYTVFIETLNEEDEVIKSDQMDFESKEEFIQFREAFLRNT